MRHICTVAAASLFCCGALAQSNDTTATPKADLSTVLESDQVQAVNGLSTSGQPSEAVLRVFAQHDYAAVIDLRTEREDRGLDEVAIVEGLGMDYVSLPIAGAKAINFENARQLDQLLGGYDAPVLVHCASGNRVGALLALRAYLNGADIESAVEHGKAAGLTRLEPRVRELLKAR